MSTARASLLVAVALGSLPACAHEGATTAFAHVVVSGATVRYSLTLADASKVLEGKDLEAVAQAIRARIRIASDGQACAPTPTQLIPPAVLSASATVVVDFACRDGVRTLEIRDDLPDALGADLHTLAKVEWPGGTGQFAFAAESREARFDLGTGASATRGAGSFFWLGVEHILTGYDHLVFLFGLVVGGGGCGPHKDHRRVHRRALASRSRSRCSGCGPAGPARRGGHRALDCVRRPRNLPEGEASARAALGGEPRVRPRPRLRLRGGARRARPAGRAPRGLLGAFNIGVEMGQRRDGVLPLVWLLVRVRGRPWEPKVAAAVSAIVLAVGLALFVERVALAG